MYRSFFLVSDGYIPDQTIDRFNNLTTLFVETGFNQLLFRMLTFWLAISIQGESRVDRYTRQFDVQTITPEEFYYPIVIYVCVLIGIAIIFAIEYFAHTRLDRITPSNDFNE